MAEAQVETEASTTSSVGTPGGSLAFLVMDPSTAVPRLRLPSWLAKVGLVDVGVVSAIVTVAVVGAVVAWWVTGIAAAVPVALVAGITMAAAACDWSTGRIPNGLVLAALVVVGSAWGFVGTFDNRVMGDLGRDLLAGCLLSGAPFLFAVWVVSPRLIGGGDWKLLAVCGLALGYLAPLAAVTMVMVGFAAAIVVAAVVKRRHVVLGPTLALGYVVAVVAAFVRPGLFGSPY